MRMTTLIAFFITVLVLIGFAQPEAYGDTIIDPGFEDGDILRSVWTATGDAIYSPVFFTVGGLNEIMAPEGNNMAVLDTAHQTIAVGGGPFFNVGGTPVSISQIFDPLLEPIWMMANFVPRAGDAFTATATVAGSSVILLALTDSDAVFPTSLGGGVQTGFVSFAIPVGATSLTFSLSDQWGGDVDSKAFIDLSGKGFAVPEPATFGLLSLGLAGLGLVQRKRSA